LRTFLARRLPDYMIPSCFVPMERLPLTPNGKVDRRALPDPESSGADRLYEAPRTEVEATLAKLFGSILGVERVGIADDFFALGGHSLKATLLVSRIHKELGVACPLREVFEHPTVAGLAGRIEAGRHRVYASIPIAEERPFYPLSSAQKRLYVIEQMGGTVTAYNMPGALLVEGALDADRLEGAVRALIARHEALRTSFMTVDGEPVQRVHAEVPFEIERIAAEASAEIDRLVADFVRPFDLAVAPLLRVGLIRLSDERSVLVFDLHHIVSDGTSMGILVRELMALYRGQALPPLRIQYKDYSAWQAGVFASELFQKETAYWLEALSGEIPVLSLPTDRPRPALQRFEGESVDLEIGADLTARLEALAAARGVTLFMLLLAAWQVLLSKWSGQEDLIVGSPIAGRPHADLEGILGMFVNTLALRGRPVGAKPFVDFLDEVKATSLGAFENQDYPFEELVERVALRRDLGRNPLFDVMFAFQNVDIPDLKIPGLRLEPVGSRRGISKFDLTLNVAPSEGGLDGSIEFATALFGRSTVVRLADHFAVLLRSIVDRPDAPIESLAIMTDEERRLVGGGFSSRRIPLPADETIPSMFERQVARDPDRIAVAFEDETLTYRELATRADRLAVQLRALGALPESIVAICIDRSLDMIVGLCGIAKSGAAFLPIDPDYPPERIRFQLADSGASILVAPRSIAERIGFSGTLLPIDEPGAIESKSGPIGIVSRPEQLAYVIYTSGSTGRPKGVLVEHRNLVAYVLGRLDVIPVFPDDRILEQHSFSFDGFLEGLYAALLTGATFVLPNRREAQDARLCAELIRRRGVSAMTTSPLFLNELNALPPLETLRTILSGGDILRPEQISELANRATVHNVYGPTEATIVATIHRCEPPLRAPIPIGRPVPNYEILIVDPSGRFLPIGVPGEIWISGAGVARGYLGRPELTRERFVPHPAAPERRAYRTGDLGRWHPDGTVEFLGRSDEQVKIRGFRVELGEIESALLAIDGIGDCAVVAAEQEGGEKELRAYLVPDSGDATGAGRLTVATIRERLALSLAQHMIPNRFVTVDRLPHTPHGKLDRKRLAEMGTALSLGTTHEAPRTEVEAAIARLFGSILGVERVGIDDDFFALGGHSLKATILVSRIHKELGVACPLREVFEHPTVAGLAERIEAGRRSVYASIPIAEKRPFYPLSSAQKRLYVIEQMGGTGTAYNMPGALLVEGPLDVPRLEGAVRGLIARHEALRTSFATVDGEPVQRVHSEVPFEIERIEGGASADVDRLVEAFVRPFDLAVAPLLRVGLIRLSDERSVLAFDLHHIVSDGTSMGILVRELMALYRGAPLPPLRLQYKDYSAWQAGVFASELFRKETAYWLEALSGEIPVLSLPTDRARPALQRFEGETVDLEIGTDLTARLEALAAERGITLFMLLLAAWQVLLSKWSGQEEVIVGSPIAGRPHADLEGILGMFVNTLALRGRPVGTKPFVDFLDETRAASLGAFENQDYPFEELVERVALRRDLGRNPLFDAMFAFQNVDIPDLEIPGLVIRPLRRRSGVSKFDLTLDLSETDGILAGSVEFATGLFDRSTVLRLAGHFAVLLRSIVDRPDAPIESLAIMTEEERRLVEGGFSSRRIPLPAGETIPSMFERQVARDPDRIAVAFEDETLTYRELALQADRLAARLRAMGALPESIVAICIDRSLDMIVGLCGIAKSGAAFLPIDPDDPPERVRFLLADSGASILVAPRSIAERIGFPGTLLPIDELDTTESMSEPIAIVSRPEQLAYVIYTSGSTGRPKGVLVEHRNLVAYIHAFLDAAPLAPDDRVLEHHSFSFDAFLEGLYASLFTGATFVLPNRSEARDVGPFAELVLRRQTTVVMTSPLFLNELDALPPLDSVRAVVCGGDVLHPEYVSKIAKRTTIYNNYGPTEATIAATIHRCELPLPAPIPIGRPVANYEVSIVDGSGRPVPIGVPGEIRISGPGVARGYLGRPELTRERFVPHPELPGQRVYRTGDLGRWRPDGAIEFLGRSDEQVKIRGFRIELGEIESALLAIDGIRECAVVATEREGEGKELRAYLVAAGDDGAGDGRLTVATLRERLALSLPEQMIPSRFVTVERLPRSTHGKLDRRRLAEMGTALSLGTTHESPRNEVEARLAEAFGEVLGVERVGIHDDFFALGGDSMKAMRLVARLAREFDLTLATVFAAPSVAAMATTVRFRPDNLRRMIAEVVEAPPVVFEPSPADRVALEAAEAEYEREVASVATLDLEERSRSRDILLTGATGYLGLHLLRDLLETTEARLHLLVRPRDDREARERLERLLEEGFDRPLPAADRERISIVPGDLEREAFGLTTDRFQALAEGVDAVVHSAANVRHYGAWDDFVRPNVLGTERLLAFATLGRPKAFHYVSTMSLGGLGAASSVPSLFTERDRPRPIETPSVYLRSKLLAEEAVERARREGLEASILRVGNLVFERGTGRFQKNIGENAFYTITRALLKVGAIPAIEGDSIDLTYIDSASRAVALLVGRAAVGGSNHHVANASFGFGTFGELLRAAGAPVEILPIERFLELLLGRYDDPAVAPFVRDLLIHLHPKRPEGEGSALPIRVRSDRTDALLGRLGFRWEPPSAAHVARMLDHGREVGFF
jgi:amino acid adenylation domain-containing protein/thioester reductase-like protein